MVSKKGISIEPEKINAIEYIALPHNKKGMQSFMGTINFVGRFVPDFAQIVKPLQQMVKQSVQFKWNDVEKNAFSKIKTSITHAPSLKSPNFEKILFCTLSYQMIHWQRCLHRRKMGEMSTPYHL